MEQSAVGRIVSVLVSPKKTFESIAERPTFLVALVVLMSAAILASVVIVPRIDIDEMIRSGVDQGRQQLTEEQIEQQIDVFEQYRWAIFVLPQAILQPALYFGLGLLFWLAFRLAGSDIAYKASLATAVHGMMPWLVATLLTVPLVLSAETIDVEQLQEGSVLMSNLGFLAGEDTSRFLRSLLGSLDFFSLWTISLLSIGYRETAKVSTGAAAGTTVAIWLVWVLGKAGFAAIMG